MDEIPEEVERHLFRLFEQEARDRAGEIQRAERIVRRARRQVAAGDVINLTLFRMWLSLLKLCAGAYANPSRTRRAPRASAS